ncbi:MAG: tRNA lysidine(34) synthetase TilS [Alphaproteobacteria bacterium]|nr:tRNA lysidine(34) synthetase TilS [Alphaproteobacteria bacterium]NCQ89221.1 tRNA lysidine(34) synthetase TilS [Alphaproteobacteria bacterium]NCT08103.1 tRNA lysidine(34) synthetase TilS [Alphaproteobacteria bacterium]
MIQKTLYQFFDDNPNMAKHNALAVGVSGGPDSMALAQGLAHIFPDKMIHVLSVDHGLRSSSADEIAVVKTWCADYKNMVHHALKWEGEKPNTAVMQEARKARYALMADLCQVQGLSVLFVAHHQDDQRETLLIRLAKGSGLDGLTGMQDIIDYNENLVIARPLLEVTKADIVAYCADQKINYVQDPSNENDRYLRPRLRQIEQALEEEGFSSKRAASLSKRVARAKKALEFITDQAFDELACREAANRIRIDSEKFRGWPDEIGLRVILKIIHQFRQHDEYGVRLEKAEALFEEIKRHIQKGEAMKRRSLGNCLFAFDPKKRALLIEQEHEID